MDPAPANGPEATACESLRRQVTPGPVVLGLVLAVLLSLATAYTDGFLAASELGGCHFPLGPVLVLFAILLPANWLFTRALRRGLGPSGLIVTFSMLLIAAGLPTFGLALYLFPVMTGPFYMASPENKWEAVFFRYLPDWIAPPRDGSAIRWFYDGAPPGQPLPWDEWFRPLLAWTPLVAAFYLAMFCLGALLRRQWTDRENLIFPLVELPLAMAVPERRDEGQPSFFRSRLLWVGFALPFVIHNLVALHAYVPAIPEIRLHNLPLFAGLVSPPWRYLQSQIYLHFSVVGVAYLLTTEISLSLWFFWWFGRLQHVIADSMGRQPLLARVEENQYQGALIAIVAYGVWVARGHLQEAWDQALRRGPTREPEALPYLWALLGLGVAGLGVVAWLLVAGVGLAVAIFTYVVFLIICWGMARLVVESGIVFAKVTQMRPTLLLRALVGPANVPPRDLTILNFVEYVFMYDLKSMMMPQLLHSLKMADEAHVSRRGMYLALAAATVVAVLASYWASLQIAYAKGALAMHPWFFINGPRGNAEGLRSMLTNPTGFEAARLITLALGAAFTWLLTLLRQRFLWFPLHPIGYVVGQGYEASRMWFPFLLGWACKASVMKYGSVKTYQVARPFFLGLVLGEYSAAGLWLAVDAALGRTGHRIFP